MPVRRRLAESSGRVTSRRAVEAVVTLLLMLAALGTFVVRWQAHPSGLAEDQSESLALARSLASGLGPRLTAASSPSLGPPNLVWLGTQWSIVELGASQATWLPRLGLGFALLALLLVGLRGAWTWRRWPRLEDAVPVWGLSLATALVEAAALGSAAVSWTLALTAVAVVLGRWLGSARAGTTGVLLGALCVVRPAAAWLFLAAAPAWWLAARMEGRRPLGEVARFLAAGGLATAVVALFRLTVFGAVHWEGLVPAVTGVEATLEFVARQSGWFWAALGATLLAAVWRRFHLRGGGTMLAWVAMTLGLACWTEQPRSLFLGCLTLLAMLVGEGLSAARDRAQAPEADGVLSRLAWVGLTGLAVVTLLAARTSFTLGAIMPVVREVVRTPAFDDEFSRRGLQEPLVAWSDAGEAAVLFPRARVVVVRRASRELEDLLVTEGPPDVVDGRVMLEAMPALAVQLAPGPGGSRWLAEQSQDDDPRCPGGRLALLTVSSEQVLSLIEQDVEAGRVDVALSRWRCALAAVSAEHLPSREARVSVARRWIAQSELAEREGRAEGALRLASLAATVSGEDPAMRGRAERLRRAWAGP